MFYSWYKIGLTLLADHKKTLPKIDSKISIKFRVRLLDCDALRIMSAYQYPMYMNFTSWSLAARSGLLKGAIKYKWAPLVGAQKIVYLSPLKRWSIFTIDASFDGWDDRWFFFKHAFIQEGKIKSFGCTKISAWKNGGIVPVRKVLEECEINHLSNPPSKWVQRLFETDIEDTASLNSDFSH